MSGEDEIIPWAVENYTPRAYDSFQEYFDVLNNDFGNNERKPLDQILDPWGIDALKEVYEKSQTKDLSAREIQTTIDQAWSKSNGN